MLNRKACNTHTTVYPHLPQLIFLDVSLLYPNRRFCMRIALSFDNFTCLCCILVSEINKLADKFSPEIDLVSTY